MDPSIPWSVKNQARMHVRNGDAPYASAIDAMRYWPETATAVAVRLTDAGEIAIAAPFGLDDPFTLLIAPTPRFRQHGREVFQARVREKNWLSAWPLAQCDVRDM